MAVTEHDLAGARQDGDVRRSGRTRRRDAVLTALRRLWAGKERDHAAALPAAARRRHARLAEQGMFGVGVRVRVLDRNRQGVEGFQRIAQDFNLLLGAGQAQFMHQWPAPAAQRWRCDSHCSR